jgi:hypothetical protein
VPASLHSAPDLSHHPADAEEAQQRVYDEVLDVAALISCVEELLGDHNAMSKRPMNLAMFLYAVEHISRVCRALKQPGTVGLPATARWCCIRCLGR